MVLRPNQPIRVMSNRSFYLAKLFIGRFSSQSGKHYLCTLFRQKLKNTLHESAKGREKMTVKKRVMINLHERNLSGITDGTIPDKVGDHYRWAGNAAPELKLFSSQFSMQTFVTF